MATRFVSMEPLIGPVAISLAGIAWLIAGGESGPGARPMSERWLRSIRDGCTWAGVPFFFKQWGGRWASAGGRLLDGIEHNALPAYLE